MKNVLFIVLLVSFTGYASIPTSGANIAAQQAAVLQHFANSLLQDKGAASKKLTAIALGTQCQTDAPVYVYQGTQGFKNSSPINKDSLFQIGSVTKSFIAVVMLQLAQERHFSLDDPHLIQQWFPEYPKWGGITLRQLLNMTSGIPGNETTKDNDIYRKLTEHEYENYIDPTTILN